MSTVAVREIYDCLNRLAPLSLAEPWDNPGLLVEADTPVSGILTALDITGETVTEAAEKGCQLIVAHHPVIFRPIKRVCHTDVVYRMAVQGISGICMHTNLDSAHGGTGDVLAQRLGLAEVRPFAVEKSVQLGRVGSLPRPMTVAELAQLVGARLQAPVKFAGGAAPGQPETVRQLAVITGSAGECWQAAQAAGAQALLTGEVSYHHALDAAAAGFPVLAAGHFATEAPVAAALAQGLRQAFPQLAVSVSETMRDVFHYQANQ